MLSAGCVTSQLLSDRHHTYEENISSLLISQDEKKIVALGKDFHYIFDAPPELVRLLRSPLKKNVAGYFGQFDVDRNDKITGTLQIATTALTPSPEDEQEALALGFKKVSDNRLSIGWTLRGTRYRADPSVTYPEVQKLNNAYRVVVSAEPTTLERLAKVPLTPITVAIDGVLVLSAVVLSPIWLPRLLRLY